MSLIMLQSPGRAAGGAWRMSWFVSPSSPVARLALARPMWTASRSSSIWTGSFAMAKV